MLLHGCDSMLCKDCKKWGLFKTQVLLCKLSTCSIEWHMMHLIFVYNMDFNFAIVHHSTQKIVQQIACQMNGKGSSKFHWQSDWTSKILHLYSSLASKDFATKQCAPLTPHYHKLLSPQCENSPQKTGKEKKTLPPICAVFMWICDVRSDCCL
jgi:hypothetical protein